MKALLFFVLSCFILIGSCQSTDNRMTNDVPNIDGWDIEIFENQDSHGVFIEPSFGLKLKNLSNSDCLEPYFKFYPIETKDTVEKQLVNYLILRSFLIPPTPNTYETIDYLVIGWNMVDYELGEEKYTCCDCEELEKQIIDYYDMKVLERPIDFLKGIK